MNGFPRLPGDRAALGTWVKLPALESVELIAEAGLDLVVIDLEHSPLSIETASALVSVALGRGLIPFVRVPDHSPSWIQRCLDLGALGIVVPHVDSLEEAVAVQRASRFEPRGRRGMGPTTRAGAWNLRGPQEYLDGGDDACVVIQIESAAGLAALPEILEHEAADGVLLGAADLSMSLGVAMDDPRVAAYMHTALEQCLTHGIPCAVATGAHAGTAARLAGRGFGLVLASNDASLLGASARALVHAVRDETEGPVAGT
ncbi:HpcH/HpaI aldolase/citrate lyase family protein [Streptomyces sp. NPDC059459]|uniref:HpcH/HpaI aldolase family protein n=1 Tax=Streptomyces sp. NPDC059459 TaxID=3346839 RepID=UPI0036994FF8